MPVDACPNRFRGKNRSFWTDELQKKNLRRLCYFLARADWYCRKSQNISSYASVYDKPRAVSCTIYVYLNIVRLRWVWMFFRWFLSFRFVYRLARASHSILESTKIHATCSKKTRKFAYYTNCRWFVFTKADRVMFFIYVYKYFNETLRHDYNCVYISTEFVFRFQTTLVGLRLFARKTYNNILNAWMTRWHEFFSFGNALSLLPSNIFTFKNIRIIIFFFYVNKNYNYRPNRFLCPQNYFVKSIQI